MSVCPVGRVSLCMNDKREQEEEKGGEERQTEEALPVLYPLNIMHTLYYESCEAEELISCPSGEGDDAPSVAS